MKTYAKPVIKTEMIFEWTALTCDDYFFYVKDYQGCMEECVGCGKSTNTCDPMQS